MNTSWIISEFVATKLSVSPNSGIKINAFFSLRALTPVAGLEINESLKAINFTRLKS